VWALVLVWRLGPRLGAFDPDPRTEGPRPQNLGLSALGVGLLVVAIPLFALGSGFLFPGQGYFGIHMTESGFGIVTVNSLAALSVGALGGAVLGYRTKSAFWILIGPIAGFVACAGLIDFAKPWATSLVAFFAPFVAFAVERWLHTRRIDEHKIIPLGLGCGAYGAILTGFVGWGVKAGGFPGGVDGYELQHAEITPWWQLVGLGATIGFTLVVATVTIVALERTVGLRVPVEDEIGGLDERYWPSGESVAIPAVPAPAPGGVPGGTPAQPAM
jgi:ammonia channel protein AmtB